MTYTTYNTLNESLKTKKSEIVKVRIANVNGNIRKLITAKKANGKRTYSVIQFENGQFSTAS